GWSPWFDSKYRDSRRNRLDKDTLSRMEDYVSKSNKQFLADIGNEFKVSSLYKFVFPMLKRPSYSYGYDSYPQPVSNPIGGIAFYRPRYGSKSGSVSKGLNDEGGSLLEYYTEAAESAK